MSLQVWLPLNGNLNNHGLGDLTFSILSSNTTISSSGKIGRCYVNDIKTNGGLISNKAFNIGTAQSMFCWFKFTDLTSDSALGATLVSQHRYATSTGMGITIRYASSTTGYLSVNTGTGSSRTYNTYYGTTLLQAGTWYHGGFTYDGTSRLKIYVDGVCEKDVNIGQMSCPSDYITVFCWSMAGSSGSSVYSNYRLNGSLNDIRIYDHALSPKEVKELSKGLIAHYPLCKNGVDDTTSTEEYDVSGFQYHGTRTGNIGWNTSSARYNSSTLFTDGRSDYISAPIILGDNTQITMSVWVKSVDGSGGYSSYHIPFCIESSKYEMSIPTNGKFRSGMHINGTRYVNDYGSVNLLDKSWHMITHTYDGANIKRYVDGELVNTQAISGTIQSGSLNLRLGNYFGTQYGDKNLLQSDARVYATALSAEDIKALYQTSASIANNGTMFSYEFIEETE